jgi:hypothetical protein
MKITPNGKYEWEGVFLDEDGEMQPFVVFADTIEQALADADMPGTILALGRGDDVSAVEIEVSDEVEARLEEAKKRALN